MAEKRFMTVWDNGKQYIWDFGDENETEIEVYSINEADDLLNLFDKENKKLKGIIQKLMINQMTITPEDMHNNQRITEITNYALVEFIKSKGYTFEEVSQFVTGEL